MSWSSRFAGSPCCRTAARSSESNLLSASVWAGGCTSATAARGLDGGVRNSASSSSSDDGARSEASKGLKTPLCAVAPADGVLYWGGKRSASVVAKGCGGCAERLAVSRPIALGLARAPLAPLSPHLSLSTPFSLPLPCRNCRPRPARPALLPGWLAQQNIRKLLLLYRLRLCE